MSLVSSEVLYGLTSNSFPSLYCPSFLLVRCVSFDELVFAFLSLWNPLTFVLISPRYLILLLLIVKIIIMNDSRITHTVLKVYRKEWEVTVDTIPIVGVKSLLVWLQSTRFDSKIVLRGLGSQVWELLVRTNKLHDDPLLTERVFRDILSQNFLSLSSYVVYLDRRKTFYRTSSFSDLYSFRNWMHNIITLYTFSLFVKTWLRYPQFFTSPFVPIYFFLVQYPILGILEGSPTYTTFSLLIPQTSYTQAKDSRGRFGLSKGR